MSRTKQYRAGTRQYRMTTTVDEPASERQMEEMMGTVRKHTYLPRGQSNNTLHNHDSPPTWQDDGLSPKDRRLRVFRCQTAGCPATMTYPVL